MKQILFALIIVMMPVVVADNILITQVMYDPIDESGGEAVELYNPNDYDVNISFGSIKTESQTADATLPQNTFIKAKSYFLVADVGWEEAKDPNWPSADYEETLTLFNSDSGTAFILNENIEDALGYGDANEIDPELYETTPANETEEEETLKRKFDETYRDTNNNKEDFIVDDAPLFHSSIGSGAGEGEVAIFVTATITQSESSINEIFLPDDEDEEIPGVQYFPIPDQKKSLLILAEVVNPDGILSITPPLLFFNNNEYEMTLIDNISETVGLFEKEITLEFYDEAGIYEISIVSENASMTTEFEYLPLIALSIDTTKLSMTSEIGSFAEILGDKDLKTDDKPTIKNIGNVEMDIGVYSSAFISGTQELNLDVFTYSFYDNIFSGSLAGTLSEEETLIPLNLAAGPSALNEFSLRFEPYENNIPGVYSGTIYLYGVSS